MFSCSLRSTRSIHTALSHCSNNASPLVRSTQNWTYFSMVFFISVLTRTRQIPFRGRHFKQCVYRKFTAIIRHNPRQLVPLVVAAWPLLPGRKRRERLPFSNNRSDDDHSTDGKSAVGRQRFWYGNLGRYTFLSRYSTTSDKAFISGRGSSFTIKGANATSRPQQLYLPQAPKLSHLLKTDPLFWRLP